ncbi:hypothetical protein EQ826_20720 [Ectopseudomonas mendocina]|nr:hypothetical protein [Pseudomonas mendocina]TRO22592.1 hypothetical protein EQ826_20720 [Pseudomonas mendocina]
MDLIDSIMRYVERFDDSDVYAYIEQGDDYLITIDEVEWLFKRLDGDKYVVASPRIVEFENYSKLPGVSPGWWVDELNRADAEIRNVLEFSSDLRLDNIPRLPVLKNLVGFNSPDLIAYVFYVCNANYITCNNKLIFDMGRCEFYWYTTFEWGDIEISGVDCFLEYFRQKLILDPIGAARMADVTPEDSQALKMMNFG